MDKKIYETTIKIAMAGFLHDLGKLVEIDLKNRNSKYKYSYETIPELYLPKLDYGYGYKHAFFTAAFLNDEDNRGVLPKIFFDKDYGYGNDLIPEIAARHHLREGSDLTPYVKIIQEGDRVASRFERGDFEDKEENVANQDYLKTRLTSVLSKITITNEDTNESYKLPLAPMSPESIFPKKIETSNESSIEEYNEILENFVDELQHISHFTNSPELWFEAFDSLWLKYAANIPEARAGKCLKDTSLYDHSRITSAITTALYLYHVDNESVESITNLSNERTEEKFTLIAGDFYGIQKFIFGDFEGEGGKGTSKILRARSLMVSLFSEFAADMLCREIGLPFSSVIFNAAGNFIILAPNTSKTHGAIKKVRSEINQWFLEKYYGECSIGFATINASSDDLQANAYQNLIIKLKHNVEIEKLNKFERADFGVFSSYLDGFENGEKACLICGKRPRENEEKCSICLDLELLGSEFVKNNKLVVVDEVICPDTGILENPIFGRYNIELNSNYKQTPFKGLLHCYDYQFGDGIIDSAKKYINGYVPLDGDSVREFEDIACSQNLDDGIDRTEGVNFPRSLLGVIKADVDNLGMLMSCGFGVEDKSRYTLSRVATASRQLNLFFSYFLPYYLQTEYPDVYTVFGGGDDLFLIGPWNQIFDLAVNLREEFNRYTANNLHFSAGIAVNKPHIPLRDLNYEAEKSLTASKSEVNKNSVTIFGETVSWNVFDSRELGHDLASVKNTLIDWYNDKIINNAFLYDLNYFIDLADQEQKLKGKVLSHRELSCLKWKATFAYKCARNIGKIPKERDLSMKQIYETVVTWLSLYRGKLRIPLWTVLYSIRGDR